MSEEAGRFSGELSAQAIRRQLVEIAARQMPAPGRRQVPFTMVETLLCYGLFSVVDPHRYGGRNIDQVPPVVNALAALFCRTPGSITSKMLNLDGSRTHTAREEPLLFATLASEPTRYRALYCAILVEARELGLDDHQLPDFLSDLPFASQEADLWGQEDIPASAAALLEDAQQQVEELERVFELGGRLTEKLVERKIRLAQHRFALEVLNNCHRTCVFCGFEPRSLPGPSGLLRASHIKPWSVSTSRERIDVRNGLAACPTHDAAFDHGYLTIHDDYHIDRARILEQSVAHDHGAAAYFGSVLQRTLLLPEKAQRPAIQYLAYHRTYIFKGQHL